MSTAFDQLLTAMPRDTLQVVRAHYEKEGNRRVIDVFQMLAKIWEARLPDARMPPAPLLLEFLAYLAPGENSSGLTGSSPTPARASGRVQVFQLSTDFEPIVPLFTKWASDLNSSITFKQQDVGELAPTGAPVTDEIALVLLCNDTVRWSLPVNEHLLSIEKILKRFKRVIISVVRPSGVPDKAPDALMALDAKFPEIGIRTLKPQFQFTFTRKKVHTGEGTHNAKVFGEMLYALGEMFAQK